MRVLFALFHSFALEMQHFDGSVQTVHNFKICCAWPSRQTHELYNHKFDDDVTESHVNSPLTFYSIAKFNLFDWIFAVCHRFCI